jgi:hypothetical protein
MLLLPLLFVSRNKCDAATFFIHLRYRGVIWFVFHALQLPPIRAGSDYAQVEGRSQTMSREESFGLKNYIKIIHCHIFEYFNGKKSSASRRKFGSSILLDPNFAREAELLAP